MQPIAIESPMNKTESAFAQYCELLKRAGEIFDYRFEPMKFMLAGNIEGKHNAVTYLPDFLIVYSDHFELAETKAKNKDWTSMKDDARCKINIAAELFPWFRWTIYYLERGRWTKELVN